MTLLRNWINYLHDYKIKETEIVFKDFSNKISSQCLEIGAGDGFQALLMRKYFSFFVSTECNKNLLKEQHNEIIYCICDAEKLPFTNKSFDFIFSSNVIEHIKNRSNCFEEIRRVLKKDGEIIHIVPSRVWKIFNCILLYPYLFLLLLNRDELARRINEKKNNENLEGQSFLKYLFPRVHGEYENHMKEFVSYGEKKWLSLFESNNFKVKRVIKLPLLGSGYGFNLGIINRFLERMGFSSSYAFFMTIE